MLISISFKIKDVRILEDPVDNKRKRYLAYVESNDLPDNIPMMTNPRKQRLSSQVARTVSQTFLNPSQEFFHVLNRGVTISAANVSLNKHRSHLTMEFNDLRVHGNIDGGHTYKIICRDRDLTSQTQYIMLEILEGYDDMFVDIAAARNTSVQVKEKSIMELRNQYDIIKEAIKGTTVDGKVAYVENEPNKPVDIEELIALLYMFDVTKFTKTNIEPPIVAAVGKSQARIHYAKMLEAAFDENGFEMMIPIVPDIIKLVTYIETNMPKAYSSLANDGGKAYFGRTSGITTVERGKKAYSKFAPDTEIKYIIPKGILYPIVSAFRYLVDIDADNGVFKWSQDPFKFAEEILPKLTLLTVNRIRVNRRSINELARDKDHWNNLYRETEMKVLKDNVISINEVCL